MSPSRGRPRPPALLAVPALLFAFGAAAPPAAAQEIQSPEAFFGHVMGEDRTLAHWDELVEYYRHLDEASPRLQLVEMGPATRGRPFLVLFVSSPENLGRLDELQEMNAVLSDPRGASEARIQQAREEGVAVIAQSFGLHSSEVAGTQSAAELAYELASRDDPEMLRILEGTLSILFPSLNPEGTALITEWYRETVGTEHEGAGMPWLYHPYIGHDNNRDAYMQNTIESVYTTRILFRDWVPQAYIDHHEMGGSTARFYIPPYAEPIRPDGDPLVWREMQWFGGQIATKAEADGILGVTNYSIYSGWGHFGFHWITPFHNTAGMLTESANTGRLASPVYLHPDQLVGGRRQLETYEPQTNHPNPWPGGWWRVRDIVEQQKLSALATLDLAARNRDQLLENALLKARRQIQRGEGAEPLSAGPEGPTAGFVIPAEQHDPLTARKLVHRLLLQGIEVREAREGFEHEGKAYGAGSYWVSLAQPKRGVARWLLGRTYYPDNHHTRDRDDRPINPYDLATHTLAEFMGVRVDRAEAPVEVPTERVQWEIDDAGDVPVPAGAVQAGSEGYVLDGRLNDAFRAANLLFDEGIELHRASENAGSGLRAGDFLVPADAPDEIVRRIAGETGVDFSPLDGPVGEGGDPLRRPRVGMYHRYWGGNMDEGWTRLTLEDFEFAYDSILDAGMTEENLTANYDAVILPHDRLQTMLGPDGDSETLGATVPEEYRSGFGEEGAEALDAFVRQGGTLIAFGSAGDLPLERFTIPVRNVLAGVSRDEFWAPGTTLRVRVDPEHPVAWGMPEQTLVLFALRGSDSQSYQIVRHDHNERADRVVTFGERDLMESGWLLGEERIAGSAPLVVVRHGEGRVVLVGFRPQHRAQTHGTLKFVFNALLSASTGR